MKHISDLSHPPAIVGNNVTLLIPGVDKAHGSLCNIIAVVIAVIDGFYKLGTKDGCLKQLYARSEFNICKEKFITPNDVPEQTEKSLRSAAVISTGKVQGYIRCQCKKSCVNNQCMCKRNNIL